MSLPQLTVVTPTRNRASSVLRLLGALARQEPIGGAYEVVLVADGCTDATAMQVRSQSWPFDVQVIEIPPSGPSTARNTGAAVARGDILLFLDDDVEPEAGALRAHAAFHRRMEGAIAIGYLPPVVSGEGLFANSLRGWWESMFDGPRRAWHRYSYRDLLSGHVSMRRADFERLGGFDVSLRCHEDWELGYRALRAGFRLQLEQGAVASHHEGTDVAQSLRRKFAEGVADVQLARMYPELIPSLPIGRMGITAAHRSRLARLAWRSSPVGDRLAGKLERVLPLLETWQLRFRWRALLARLMTYWYWRGVASEVGTREALAHVLSTYTKQDGPDLTVDLREGLETVLVRVDNYRPRSLRILDGSDVVGDIEARPGSEPLHANHVRRELAHTLGREVARALARNGDLPAVLAGRLLEAPSSNGVANRSRVFAA